mmetsp:Transcript_20566/g.30208  ORF Transcript_20566/g.30208 Transcript_20566/m.30208 type:complete len:317 (-) Transcript_20566:181-1131(-)
MSRTTTTHWIIIFLAVVGTYSKLAIAFVLPAPVVNTLIGAVAGAAGAFTVYPIDYVKTHLQTESAAILYPNGGYDAARSIVTEEGILALYRGVGTQVVGVAPEKAIKLAVNDILRSAVAMSCGGLLPLWGEVLAGASAGMCQVIVTNPLEVLKVGIQTSKVTVWELIHDAGVSGLYRGAETCMLRDAMFSAILFPLYAHMKISVPELLETMDIELAKPIILAMAGTIAATPAAYLSTPADVVKTRIQALNKKEEDGATKNKKPLEIVCGIIKTEGPHAFFSGGFERVMRSAPQFGVTLALFDVLKTYALHHHLLLS